MFAHEPNKRKGCNHEKDWGLGAAKRRKKMSLCERIDYDDLFEANSVESLASAIKNGIDVSLVDSEAEYFFEHMCRIPILLKVWLDVGGDPNMRFGIRGENNALSVAITFGSVESVRLLLEAGADVNSTTEFSYGNKISQFLHAVWCATPYNRGFNGDVLKMLLDAGADINAKDENGRGAFAHLAYGWLD